VIYVERWTGERSAPVLVFLHHGLGSVSQWRDYPGKLCQSLGLLGMAYDRAGHGRSPDRGIALGPDYLHQEARVLEELLVQQSIDDAILIGHSDGGSIALMCRSPQVRGVITEAAHVFVEPITREGIRDTVDRYASDIRQRLVRHHGEKTDRLFAEWAGIWLSPDFDSWNIEAEIVRDRPVFALQGADDPYGTPAQLEAIGGTTLLIPNCRHEPHFEASEATFEAMRQAILQWL
jgi:pimeloyl-ACP methyl ester carboxylesterase